MKQCAGNEQEVSNSVQEVSKAKNTQNNDNQ